MNHDYDRCYRVLDLPNGSEWHEVRRRYRSLMRQWHPDHFQADSVERGMVEDRAKEITQAYRAIEKHYRAHGTTPGKVAVPFSAPRNARATATPERTFPDDVQSDAPAARPLRRTIATITLTTIGAFAVYFALDIPDPITINTEKVEPESLSPLPLPPDIPPPAERRTFSRGSSLGEVYSVQGVPTKTEKNVWHYGYSKVVFDNGRVSNWENHPESPLRVDSAAPKGTTDNTAHLAFFSHGSTKAEVRAIQGRPSREDDSVWEYGSSKVYFKGNHVVSWHESPLYPLRIANH